MRSARNRVATSSSPRPRSASAWTALPLFPLGTVLFPGGLLPLKVFEARYLDLVSDCLRSGAPFAVVRIRQGGELRSAGIACILGTGSNSCYYDGVKILDNVPSLGWLLGDNLEDAFGHLGFLLLYVIGGLAGAVLGREIGLDAVLLHAAEGRIGQDHIELRRCLTKQFGVGGAAR